jgi:hypothetical protein
MADIPDFVPDSELSGILDFPCGIERLPNGNTLIADAGTETSRGSEVIEVDPKGNVIWRYHDRCRFTHGVKRLANGNTLVADTTSDRLIEIKPDGTLAFSSDDWANGTGKLSDGSHLHYPNNVHCVTQDRFMVTDRNSNRYVVVDRQGQVYGKCPIELKHPHNCEPLANGNVIVADSDHNQVVEITPDGSIAWKFSEGLYWPRDANRLANGNTLIGDSKNNRVLEVTPDGKIAWKYQVDYFSNFYEAHRLANGNTLISDQQHKQVIEVNPAGEIVWKFRNFRRDTPIYEKLQNTSFKNLRADGTPACWFLATRFSEGGGKFAWGENRFKKKVPGVEYDRSGALCLQQTVKVTTGQRFTMGGAISTQDLKGFACMQVAYVDAEGGLLCEAANVDKGQSFSDTTDWTPDSFETTVPPRAVAADIRLFISGAGKAFFSDLRFFC